MKQAKVVELERKISKAYKNIAGVVVLQNGKLLYENHFNGCNNTSTIHLYSVTKSIVSILLGIAIDKGYIKSIDQKILEFFPDYVVAEGEKTIQHITIKNMLTMTIPYKHASEPYIEYFTSDNFAKFALDAIGGQGQIGEFRYAPLVGPDILTAIIARATGKPVLDFAKEYLFTPLGIHIGGNITFKSEEEQFAFNEATNISGWVVDQTGVNTAGWGLTLAPVDMAKIGQLYLEGGIWNGKQIVPRKWIEESTKEHSRWEAQNLPYGYLWWLINDKGSSYAAMGDGGNIIYVDTDKKLVVAIAALLVPEAKDSIAFIKAYVEPICEAYE